MNTRQAGITLTEIILAICLLGFLILPIMSILNYSNRGTREQEAEGIAANLAKEEMNRLMFILNSDQLANGGEWSFGPDYGIKGNYYSGSYEVKYFDKTESFVVPKFVFHDPVLCKDGREMQPESTYQTNSAASQAKRKVVLAKPCMADIKLTVKYRLSSEKEYDKRHTIVLYGRRALID